MKKSIVSLCLAPILCLSCFSFAESDGSGADAAMIMDWIMSGDTASIAEHATDEVNQAMPESVLEATLKQLGEFSFCEEAGTEEIRGYTRVSFHVVQGGTGYTYLIVLDGNGKLAGLNIQPWQTDSALTGPDAQEDGIVTERLTLREGGPDATDAYLTLPEGEGPFPAAILVHGSGPSNYNESAYGISPFEDLATGLAKAGIATIRYDKYTYAHADIASADPGFTVEEEYINDARAALSLLTGDERISGIYLIGHSQGGMLMPRIINELGAENFSGGVSIGGSPLHLWEIQYAQNLAAVETMSGSDKELYLPLIEAEAEKARALAGCAPEDLPQETVFGLPASYQYDEISYDAAELFAENGVPCLAVQGDADWQVPADMGTGLWKQRCPAMTVVLMPQITHMMTCIDEPTGTTEDYVSGSHVDRCVIEVISDWILTAQ